MTTHLPDSAVGPQTMTKVTRRLIPFLVLLYFVNYLDRVNISFAGPNGMNEDLAMSAKMFGFASGIFFIGYLLLEVPSNIALNKFGGRRWIARIMLTWGIISSAIAFVPNAETLVVLRFLLGVAEAGFFPGIILYLTFWFPEKHRSKAISLFMVAVPVSTAVGSTLSSLIIDWGHGIFGLEGWRVMFLVEGIPAVILAFVCWFYLTDRPAEAAWLNADQKDWLETTLDFERSLAETGQHWPLKKALSSPEDPPTGVHLLRNHLRPVRGRVLSPDDRRRIPGAVRHASEHHRARPRDICSLRRRRHRDGALGAPLRTAPTNGYGMSRSPRSSGRCPYRPRST